MSRAKHPLEVWDNLAAERAAAAVKMAITVHNAAIEEAARAAEQLDAGRRGQLTATEIRKLKRQP